MEQLTPVILKHDKWEATILPGFGNNLVKLTCSGIDVLRTPNHIDDLKHSPYLYGTPLLFPANRVSGGKFFFGGKDYHLPINEPLRNNHIHGLVYNAHFCIMEQKPDMLKTLLVNRGEYFPLPFQLSVSTNLSEDGIYQELCLLNTGATELPISLAFHTTFVEPDQFCVPIGKRYEWDDNFIPTGTMCTLNNREQSFVIGAKPDGTAISGYYTSCGNTAKIGNFSYTVHGFDHWTMYNGGGNQNFLCVEPQLGPVNSLNSGNAPILAVGQQMNFKWMLRELEL